MQNFTGREGVLNVFVQITREPVFTSPSWCTPPPSPRGTKLAYGAFDLMVGVIVRFHFAIEICMPNAYPVAKRWLPAEAISNINSLMFLETSALFAINN